MPTLRITLTTFVAGAACAWLGACNGTPDDGASAPPRTPQEDAWLTDVSDETGLRFRHDDEADTQYFMPQIMGAGGAFLDYDGDGSLDVFLLNGRWSRNDESARPESRLFRQQPGGIFVDATQSTGLTNAVGYGV